MSKRFALGVCAMVITAAASAAAQTTLSAGRSARLVDRPGVTADRAVVRFTGEGALFTLVDPCSAEATLRLTTSSGDTGEIALPCAKWRRAGSGFLYTGSASDAGGVFRIVYKSGRLIAKLRGPGYGALAGPVAHVEVRFSVGATRYCGRFTDLRTNKPNVIAARGPTTACNAICGDGHVDAGEQCDDGNALPGDCCSATCQYETSACDDGDGCTAGDTCMAGACVATPVAPWINEFDYDDFTGALDDRDEFLEIAAPAGTDLGGYKILAVEGNLNGNLQADGAPCYSDPPTQVPTGSPYFTAVIPPGTIVGDDTGTGIGLLVACFTGTSANHEAAGECDVVLPAPDPASNLKNGHLLNSNLVDCPDGVLLLDPFDNLVDSLGYEGLMPDLGLFGDLFQLVPYSVGQDQGFVARVSFEKRSSSLARATSASEWSLSGGCIDAGLADPGCQPNSDSPGSVNPGQLLACVPSCGNGAIDEAAGESCDPAAAPSGCGPGEGCIDAGLPGECSCEVECGNGVLDAGEECDPPGSADQCAAGGTCNSDCTCPPPPGCASTLPYVVAESGLDLCTAVLAPCPPPVPVGLAPPATQTSFDLCFQAPDAAGRVGLQIEQPTWFADATYVPAGAIPLALTQRFCQSGTATGVLFTQDGADSHPARRCLAGDPSKLLRSCTLDAECEGPPPASGNGICGTRDVDYTSTTSSAGTTFTFGDGAADPTGAVFLRQVLDAEVYLNVDARCTGDGVDPSCVGCDHVTPAPAGRIGVNAAATPSLVLPLVNHWVSGSVANQVAQPGNVIDGRAVAGGGAVRATSIAGDYELAACNARLQIPTPLGVPIDIQFLTSQLFSPAP